MRRIRLTAALVVLTMLGGAFTCAAASPAKPDAVYLAKAQFLYTDTMADSATAQYMDDRLTAKQQEVDGLQHTLISTRTTLKTVREQHRRDTATIAQLAAQADAQAQALAQAQDTFVSELAKKDQALAAQITYMRDNVDHILQSPEGLDALEKINAGDIAGGAQVLDALNTARATARKTAYDKRYAIETAADQRATADVLNGREPVTASIFRYERVTALDDGVAWDWIELSRLYQLTGDLDKATQAAETATGHATTPEERGMALDELGDIQLRHDQFDQALNSYQQALDLARTRMTQNPSPDTRRAVAHGLVQLASVYMPLGRLDAALMNYRESLELDRTLAVDPADSDSRHDLSLTLLRAGTLYMALNRLEEAVASFRESTAIARDLAADPTDRLARHHLAVTLDGLADGDIALGRLDDALAAARESVAIARALAAADPGNAESQRNLSIALNKAGNILWRQDKPEDALALYTESLAIVRPLAADPDHADAQRDLSATLEFIGSVYMTLDRRPQDALPPYQECLDISRRQLTAQPSALAQRNLSVGLNDVGDALMELDKPDQALPAYQEGLDLARALAVDSTNAGARRDVSVSLNKVGDAALALDRRDQALASYTESLAIRRDLAADPTNASARRDVAVTLWNLAGMQAPGYGWQQVIDQLQLMKASGQLSPADQSVLADARNNLAAERKHAKDKKPGSQT